MDPDETCPFCRAPIPSGSYFCPSCGKQIKQKLVSTSIGRQILIYSISFLLPPFGLRWGIPYVRSTDEKARIIGVVSILLTVASVVASVFVVFEAMNQYSKILNSTFQGTSPSLGL